MMALCCGQKVKVFPIEAVVLAGLWSEVVVKRLRALERQADLEGVGPEEYLRLGWRCAFLSEGWCMVYYDRLLGCAAWNVVKEDSGKCGGLESVRFLGSEGFEAVCAGIPEEISEAAGLGLEAVSLAQGVLAAVAGWKI